MQVRELVSHLAQQRLQPRLGGGGEHPKEEKKVLALTAKVGGEKIILFLLAEEALDRPVGDPVEVARDVEPHAVARKERDEPESIELQEPLESLGLGEAVSCRDLGEAPTVQHARRNQQQRRFRDEFLLLRLGERANAGHGLLGLLREFREAHAKERTQLHEALQREGALREHTLHALLGNSEGLAGARVRVALLLQQAFERGDHPFALDHALWYQN